MSTLKHTTIPNSEPTEHTLNAIHAMLSGVLCPPWSYRDLKMYQVLGNYGLELAAKSENLVETEQVVCGIVESQIYLR